MDNQSVSTEQVVNTQPAAQSTKRNVPLVSALAAFWTILAYLIVVVTMNSLSAFQDEIIVTDYLRLFKPGLLSFEVYYGSLDRGFNIVPFSLDFLLVLIVIVFSTLLFFHQRASRILFFIISGLFLLFSGLNVAFVLEECQKFCLAGFVSYLEVLAVFVAASSLPILWLSRKQLDAAPINPSRGFFLGLPIFVVVILIGALSIVPISVVQISEIHKMAFEELAEVEQAKSNLSVKDYPTFSDESKVTDTSVRRGTLEIHYSNGVRLGIGELGNNKVDPSYQIARDVIEGRDKDKFATNPDYLLQERTVNNVGVTYYRGRFGGRNLHLISYEAFFSLGNKDFKIGYSRFHSEQGFSEMEFSQLIEAVIDFYQ